MDKILRRVYTINIQTTVNRPPEYSFDENFSFSYYIYTPLFYILPLQVLQTLYGALQNSFIKRPPTK